MTKLVPLLFLVTACTATPTPSGSDAGSDGDGGRASDGDAGSGGSVTCAGWDGGTPESCGVYCVTGDLPGVRLTLTSDRCMYRSGDDATFEYTVYVDPSAPAIHVTNASAGNPCSMVSSDPTSFVDARVDPVSGTDPHYCSCESGNCAGRGPPHDITLATGSASGTFHWPGRAWDGESDTVTPYGGPFPPGDYVVTVAFRSGGQGDVVARLPITITP